MEISLAKAVPLPITPLKVGACGDFSNNKNKISKIHTNK